MPKPTTGPPKRIIKEADKAFDADIRHLLEWATVGFKYEMPTTLDSNPEDTDQYATRLYEFMVAESYLVQMNEGYMVTASGRKYRKHLQRNFVTRWWHSNYQWLIVTAVAIASLITAVASVVIAANG